MAHNHDALHDFRSVLLVVWALFFMVIAVLTLFIVRIKNYLRGEEGLSFTMPPALKYVNLSLIVRCTLIWVVIMGVVVALMCLHASGGKVFPGPPISPFIFIIGIFGVIALSITLFLSIFLPLTIMVSLLLTRAKVRSVTLIMSALLPVPFIAFIGPIAYLGHGSHKEVGLKIMFDLCLCVFVIPSAIFWARGIRRGIYRTGEPGRLPPSEEGGPEEGST